MIHMIDGPNWYDKAECEKWLKEAKALPEPDKFLLDRIAQVERFLKTGQMAEENPA